MKKIWTNIAVFGQIIDALRRPSDSLTMLSLPGASGASLVAEISEMLNKPLIIVVKDQETAFRWYRDLRFFVSDTGNEVLTERQSLFSPGIRTEVAGQVVLFPEKLRNTNEKNAEFDAHAHASLRSMTQQKNPIAVIPASFLMVTMKKYKDTHGQAIKLHAGVEKGIRSIAESLIQMGYEKVYRVEVSGEIAIRGGILDVFVPMYSYPVRIEFFGNEIISIREFDPLTQKSISRVNHVELIQMTKFNNTYGSGQMFFDCFSEWFKQQPPVFWIEPDIIIDSLQKHNSVHFSDLSKSNLPGYPSVLLDWCVESDTTKNVFSLPVTEVPEFDGDWLKMVRTFRDWSNRRYKIHMVYSRESVRKHVSERLTFQDLSDDSAQNRSVRSSINSDSAVVVPVYTAGELSRGFLITDQRIAFVAENDITGLKQKQRWKRPAEYDQGLSFSDLQPGDYVVHTDHGIGCYAGLQRLVVNGKVSDFLLLKYADLQKLYVPVDKLYLIQKYLSSSEKRPHLDKMGGVSWRTRKKKVHESVLKLAAELLDLFSRREASQGYSFQKDDYWQQEFELGFEYEETPDQLDAILDVKKDMENSRPMDRIVCGDVGFGKTEVAMRAAFKAAVGGKQVAVLAPTTILVQQHFRSFLKRFEKFPVVVSMLSRFLKTANRKSVLKGLKEGIIDVVIGTHSLLADSVEFKDLGLLVIDEEHRFGVRQKEKLKQLRSSVDVLTLTATPIPRTMNMAFLGLRDISLIRTAPEARLPIKSIVTRFSLDKIRRAILDEINRGGQIYFVHNRVQSIGAIENMLHKLVPEARLAVGHGQMTDSALEKIMLRFLDKEFDILLCTTIIESGLDIPTVNTIIINRADRMGLAQLHQLRGRVGRDRYQAYAWLLVPPQQVLSKKSRLRLEAIQQAVELGSGFGLAARDLDIRGAGDILGPNQHGHISAVGFEMYCRLIREAVQELKGEPHQELKECDIRIPCETAIPEAYMPDPSSRLDTYRRFSTARSNEQIIKTLDDLKDEFGDPPNTIYLLADLANLRIEANRLDISKIEFESGKVIMVFRNTTPVKPNVITDLIIRKPCEFQFKPPGKLTISVKAGSDGELVGNILQVTKHFVQML